MYIKEIFHVDCQKIFDKNKLLLEKKMDISDKNILSCSDNLYIFNKIFDSHQKDIANQLVYYFNQTDNMVQSQNLETLLSPIAQGYLSSFLNLVSFPILE